MAERDPSKISRRQILAGAGVAAAGAATLGMAGARPARAQDPSWDREADIVVVGSGAAACSAAATSASLGNKVVLIEKEPILGGTTNKSGGVAWVPNNSQMRAAGKTDPKADCMKYMVRYSYPQRYTPNSPTLGLDEASYKLIEAFYDNGAKAIDHLGNIGAVQFGTFLVGGKPSPDYADHLPENKAPQGRSVVTLDDSGKIMVGTIGDGTNLIGHVEAWLRKQDVPILTEHKVVSAVKDGDRVVGVEAEADGKTVRIRARKGVIFATGGYAHNVDLVHLHQKGLWGSCAMPGSTGDFIGIAQSAGAAMGAMGTAWRTQIVFEQALENRVLPQGVFFVPADSMFLVNKYGRRVVNEKRDYNDRTEVHFYFDPVHEDYANELLFMIFDGRSLDAFGGAFPIPDPSDLGPYVIQGADMDELAANLANRLDTLKDKDGMVALADDFPKTLKETLDKFNAYAKAGKDPDFKRGDQSYDRAWQAFFSVMREGSTEKPNDLPNPTMHPFRPEGPYYAIILAAGALDTSGGPRINEHAQVLAPDGTPIAGLYGAGNCIAAPSREAYYGAGGTIGPCIAFGYIAAQHAHGQSQTG